MDLLHGTRIASVQFLAVLGLFCSSHAEVITATTKYGKIRGTMVPFASSPGRVKSIKAYFGVPFAAPPIGELRFQPPKPPLAWSPTVFNATRFGNVCIQTPIKELILFMKRLDQGFNPRHRLSEDCLYLNIAEPGVAPMSGKYPVMVYIHGGGYKAGISFLSPGYQLALREVVVVTIQYRLGPFGFLSTGDEEAAGNYGMLDQIQALKWVKENIKNFNGDPNKVTIFGLSAGSTSVALHLLSPLSRGLFHAAASESGVDLTPWAAYSKETAVKYTKAFAKRLACDVKENSDLVKCLRGKEAWALVNASMEAEASRLSNLQKYFLWAPVVDGNFLPDIPAALREKAEFIKVPYLAGITPKEYAFFLGTDLMNLYGIQQLNQGINTTIFEQFVKAFARMIQLSTRYSNLLADALQFEYFPWPKYPSVNNQMVLQKAVDFTSDFYYLAPTQASLLAHSKYAPAYMFVFNHRSNFTHAPAWKGVTHADSYSYVFGVPLQNQTLLYDDTDKNISDAMVTMWTNLAKYGNPTPPNHTVYGATWNRFSQSNQVYMSFGGQDVARMEKNYHGDRVAFWNYYYPKLMNESPQCPTVTSGSSPLSSEFHVLVSSVMFIISALMVV